MSDDPYLFQSTRDLMNDGPLWPTATHGALVASLTDLQAFLAALGIGPGERVRRADEVRPEIVEALLTCDRHVGLVFTWDEHALRLHMTDDPDIAAKHLHIAEAGGVSACLIVPGKIREWLLTKDSRYVPN